MTTWTIRFNEQTTMYEVHRAGCAHLMATKFKSAATYEATTGTEAAAAFEASNEGCLTKTAPCAKAVAA